jgi:hypothetical protein
MIYVSYDNQTGQIFGVSNKDVLGVSSAEIGLDLDVSEVLQNRYIKDGVPAVRPDLDLPDNLSFDDEVKISLGVGGKVLCFDKEWIDDGNGVVVNVPNGVFDFGAVVIPPFPYKPKTIQVRKNNEQF